MALEDLEGLVEGRGGGDPGGTAEAKDGTNEGFVGMEYCGRIQAPGSAAEEFQETEAVVSFGLDGAEVRSPREVTVEGEAEVLQGGGEADGAVMDGEVKVREPEGRGGTTYEDRLGFGRIDGEEPLVAPGGKGVKVGLEEVLGPCKGGGNG